MLWIGRIGSNAKHKKSASAVETEALFGKDENV
jgi:hypothetical protein